MNSTVEYRMNYASIDDILLHLFRCDSNFVPRLSARTELVGYSTKVVSSAARFEAWSDDELIGLAAVYCNDFEQRIAFITNMSVLKASMGKGVATQLTAHCIEHAKRLGMRQLSLDVACDNARAVKLYKKMGFSPRDTVTPVMCMYLNL
jgi:ribosomal protein S18 acetylase RimI-like enzyme